MSCLLPRVLGRTFVRSTLQQSIAPRIAISTTPTTIHAAFLSVKAAPSSPRPNNPNLKQKISPNKRPLARPIAPPPTKTETELAQLPYIVRRTPSAQLPVYRRWMSGGNRQVVLVKKVDGDRKQLLDDLVEALGVPRDNIRINPTTQHIEFKVYYGHLNSSSTIWDPEADELFVYHRATTSIKPGIGCLNVVIRALDTGRRCV